MKLTPLKDQAEVCRIGLEIGLLSKPEVVAWADKVIEKGDNIEYCLIELSLKGSKPDFPFIRCLQDIKGIPDRNLDKNILLGICSKKYESSDMTTADICRILEQLFSSDYIEWQSDFGKTIDNLITDLDAAAQEDDGSLEDWIIASDAFEKFLSQYSAYYTDFL